MDHVLIDVTMEQVHVHEYMYYKTYIHIYMHVTHVCSTYIHVYMYVNYVHLHVCVCTYVCMYMCTYIQKYVHICIMYIHTI